MELELEEESTIQNWIEEAQRLESAQKYNKAYDAYKKANNREGQERCKKKVKELELWINTLGIECETAIRIENDGKPLSEEIILKSLDKICNQFNVYIDSQISAVVQCNNEGAMIWNEVLDDSDRLKELAKISKRLTESNKDIIQGKLTLHVQFVKENSYVMLIGKEGEEIDTIYVDHRTGNNDTDISLSYARTKYDSIESHLNALNSELDKLGFAFDDIIREKNYYDYISKATEMYEKGNIRLALSNYKKAFQLIKDKDYLSILKGSISCSIGGCYYKLSDYNMAEKLFKASIDYDENNFEPYNNLGVIHLNLGDIYSSEKDFDKSIQLFKKALQLNPKYPEARSNLMIARKMLQKLQGKDLNSINVNTEKPKTGRNDPCPCGNGKKYKKCCIDKDNKDY